MKGNHSSPPKNPVSFREELPILHSLFPHPLSFRPLPLLSPAAKNISPLRKNNCIKMQVVVYLYEHERRLKTFRHGQILRLVSGQPIVSQGRTPPPPRPAKNASDAGKLSPRDLQELRLVKTQEGLQARNRSYRRQRCPPASSARPCA